MKVIDPAILAGTRVHARYCEGEHCCDPDGETHVYPILFAARVILCRPCWEQENRYRRERGKELGCPKHWPTKDWDAAQPYRPMLPSAETTAIPLPPSGPATRITSVSETASPLPRAA